MTSPRHTSTQGRRPVATAGARRLRCESCRGLTEYTGEGREQDGIPTTFTYDADPSTGSGPAAGLRRQSQTAAGAVKFVLDGQDVLLETDGNGATQAACTICPVPPSVDIEEVDDEQGGK